MPLRSGANLDSKEHTLAIQGEKGIGKSCLLKILESHFSDLKVIRLSIPEKITKEKELLEFLGKGLGCDLSEGLNTLITHDAETTKTLILLDEAQNLFLARRRGFEAFRLFTNLCNVRTHNLFWCATFNRFGWTYLNAVTGGSQFFRHTFAIDEWSDGDITKLILSRHEKTGFTLEFDRVVFALDGGRGQGERKLIQERYFEMLWEQSKGNPRTALTLWLSALQIEGKKVKVGLPASSPLRPLLGLTDNEMFVISAIIRHENLTPEEAESVTNLPASVVRHAFRIGLERNFLENSESDRYRVRPLWQAPLTQTLVHKNFVYGE